MVKNFLEFIFLYFFFCYSAIGYGSLILKKFNFKYFYSGLAGIIGLFFFSFIITFLHFLSLLRSPASRKAVSIMYCGSTNFT